MKRRRATCPHCNRTVSVSADDVIYRHKVKPVAGADWCERSNTML